MTDDMTAAGMQRPTDTALLEAGAELHRAARMTREASQAIAQSHPAASRELRRRASLLATVALWLDFTRSQGWSWHASADVRGEEDV